MARSHLTLAALATSAVAGLDVAAAQPFTSNRHGDFDTALLTARDGHHYLVRVPNSDAAEAAQNAELTALASLSSGVRSRLPFALSSFIGQTLLRSSDGKPARRATVYRFVYGRRVRLERLYPGPLPESIGTSIAAIHSLPSSFVVDSGLPVVTAIDNLRSVVTVMDRAAATSMVPAALLSRWESATDDTKLWQFQPTVIHGAMNADALLHSGDSDDRVVGIIGWSDLRIGDPARDLSWILSAPSPATVDQVLDAYAEARPGTDVHELRRRAMLYAELELAKWLLYGYDTRDGSVVDDAVQMLDVLVQSVQGHTAGVLEHETGPILDVDEVQRMLDEHPQVAIDHRSRSSLSE
jgi:macrolide phosphotransferase